MRRRARAAALTIAALSAAAAGLMIPSASAAEDTTAVRPCVVEDKACSPCHPREPAARLARRNGDTEGCRPCLPTERRCRPEPPPGAGARVEPRPGEPDEPVAPADVPAPRADPPEPVEEPVEPQMDPPAPSATDAGSTFEPVEAVELTAGSTCEAFPVAGDAWYQEDWHAPRSIPNPHLHEGTDIFAATGTPVRAPDDGIIRVTDGAVGGLAVYVVAGDGSFYYLAHLSGLASGVATGAQVAAGATVGFVGTSGNAAGGLPHLHIQIHPGGGDPVDPKPILDRWLDACGEPKAPAPEERSAEAAVVGELSPVSTSSPARPARRIDDRVIIAAPRRTDRVAATRATTPLWLLAAIPAPLCVGARLVRRRRRGR